MGKDILLPVEEGLFSYRVAGILIYQNKLLLQKPLDDDGFAFPGGHIVFGETHAQTLEREFLEETGVRVSVDRLFAVGEIFFSWNKKHCQQISLFYFVKPQSPDELPVSDFYALDEAGGCRADLMFHWVALDDLETIQLYPPQLARPLREGTRDVLHFVYREGTEDR